MNANLLESPTDLAYRVEAFEEALEQSSDADLGRFLPEPHDASYPQVLAELVRVDLEHAWNNDRPRRLDEYRRFPGVFEDRTVLEAVAFEEYRLRKRGGETISPDQYRAFYNIDTTRWPSLEPASTRSLPAPHMQATNAISALQPKTDRVPASPSGEEPDAAEDNLSARWSVASRILPEPGMIFLGFHLMEELGRGAFGRVYLAHQGDLASRPVALKVACDIADESQKLAQLQHTNIVPIYSFHRLGALQAACMPYFGRTTLARVLEQVNSKAGLPSSGRQLKSTLNLQATTVRTSSPSPSPSHTGEAAPTSLPESPVLEPMAAAAPADGWAKLEGLSYVEAVLWLGEQIADGLAHAHERGIIHRDLKPANVLLTDDGRPMLLDFNLAEDSKTRGSAERASIGGTLPYMSPEHIDAFTGKGPRTVDARTDLFSLGVILFELLTGRHPYPIHKKKVREAIPAMLADRRAAPPMLRDLNPAVSPATEAIIRKCLAGNPDDRYQKAEHLRDDLNRQLRNAPLRYAGNPSRRERLRKWVRRHPRLASSGTVAAVAALLLLAVGGGAVYSRERAHDLQAHAQFVEHAAAFDDAQLFLDDRNQSRARFAEALTQLRGVLARYGVDETRGDEWLTSDAVRRLPAEERDRLRGDIGETFYLMAEVALLQAKAADPQSADRAAYLGDAGRWHAAAERLAGSRLPWALRSQADSLAAGAASEISGFDIAAMDSPRDLYLLGARLTQNGEHFRSRPFLVKATQLDPHNFSAWFVRGTMHLSLSQCELAAECFTACLALRDDFAPAWLNRGRAYTALRFFDLAAADYDRAIQLKPNWAEAYIQRASAIVFDHPKAAIPDFTRALETGAAPVRVYFLRSQAYRRTGQVKEADADRAAGLKLTPTDELGWVGRSEMHNDTPAAALADVEEALKLNPFSIYGIQQKAFLLAEKLKKPEEAIAVLDRGVRLHPDHAPLRAGRGVLLARAGKREAAHADAREALRCDGRNASNQFQVGCIYALTAAQHPEDKPEAISLLWAALKAGFGFEWIDVDPDLNALRKDRGFQEMVADAKVLEAARKK